MSLQQTVSNIHGFGRRVDVLKIRNKSDLPSYQEEASLLW